jgi:ribonuclease BN (tRNA processing enzyme)
MIDGITVRILGDFGPFSRMGKSISYQINIGESGYIIDCGSPLFQQIGGHGLKEIDGLIITHCHDDHKRWFTDLALFNMYAADVDHKVLLLTSEEVHNELMNSSGPALDRSLSRDSEKVIDISYKDYIHHQVMGPRAKYRIVSVDEGNGKTGLHVQDRDGNPVGPDRAKIIISTETRRPRMLFKDPDRGEWVEPESFYPFSSDIFYEENKNVFINKEGFTIEAIKAPVWHGLPVMGVRIRTDKETLVFSSDTVNNLDLWKKLCSEKKTQKLKVSRKEFESSRVIYGDINDYIERTWSEERYNDAVNEYNDAIVIHDVSIDAGAVHTEYNSLKNTSLKRENVILTHAPDKITSEWALCDTDKNFKIVGKKFYEIVGDKLYPMNADIYCKDAGKYWVGYRNDKGKYLVYEKNGLLNVSIDEAPHLGKLLYRVDLYQDILGRYFPKLEREDAIYAKRKDLRIELVEITDVGSTGKIIEDHRDRLLKR